MNSFSGIQLIAPQADSTGENMPVWSQQSQSLSGKLSADIHEFCFSNDFSLECLLAAAGNQLLTCYSPDEHFLPSIEICRTSAVHRLLFKELQAPALDRLTIGEWLRRINDDLHNGVCEAVSQCEQRESSTPSQNQLAGVHLIIAAASEEEKAVAFARGANASLVLTFDTSTTIVSLALSYDARRFAAEFVEILVHCLAHIFGQLPARASEPVSALTLVTQEIQNQYPATAGILPAASSFTFVHELIEQQARRAPDAVAAVFGDEHLTYADLVTRAQRLADHLRLRGSGPGTLVAIHLGRSIDLVISILAVLQTGAAFLPLDPWLPTGRIEAVMEDSQAPLLLTRSALAYRFDKVNTHLVLLDSDGLLEKAGPGQANPVSPSPHDLAYVIYTSGSTGVPKGVMIEHRNLAAFLPAFDKVGSPASGTMLALSSPSFDVSVIELLWTLSRGMRVILHEGDGGSPVFLGPDSIATQITKYGVTHLLATPTLMRILADDPAAAEALQCLRVCMVGGEAFTPGLGSLLLGSVPGLVINGYGPTETTVCATYHALDAVTDPTPIGKPLSNTSLYVVDRWNRLLPPLAPGELLIGGPSVGRGYLRRPELTAQRFITNPFDKSDPYRLYRTGDLVRLNLRGNFEFLDRLDSQVKIRGYRIELGEIEAALGKHPGVRQAAVVVQSEANGEKTLVAYYTCVASEEVGAAELHTALTKTLPHYMVPSVLRNLTALPRSTSGKIDRIRLASLKMNISSVASALASQEQDDAADTESPTNREIVQIERQLCAWLSELLRLPSVKPTDDYFAIGGESLTAAQFMRRIAAEYGVNLRLSTLTKERTARALATLLVSASPSDAPWSPLVPFRTTGSQPPLFLIAGLGGNVVNFEFISRLLTDRPVYGVETHGIDQKGEVLTSMEDMARLYLTEMRKVQPAGPYHLAGYSFGGVLAFEMAHQLEAADEQISFLGLIDSSEWHYTRRVLNQLSRFKRLNFLYGNTIRQILCGPNRVETLRTRLRIAVEHRRLARTQSNDGSALASVASVEQRNYHAISRYFPKSYGGSIHLFRTADQTPLRGTDPTLGWKQLCASVIVEDIPGEHETLTSQAFARSLASKLEDALLAVEHVSKRQRERKRSRTGDQERAA